MRLPDGNSSESHSRIETTTIRKMHPTLQLIILYVSHNLTQDSLADGNPVEGIEIKPRPEKLKAKIIRSAPYANQ